MNWLNVFTIRLKSHKFAFTSVRDMDLHFRLQYRINGSDWARYAYVMNDGRARYRYELTFMNGYSDYEFRVIANANNEGYPRPGVPGPESDIIKPRCIGKFSFHSFLLPISS